MEFVNEKIYEIIRECSCNEIKSRMKILWKERKTIAERFMAFITPAFSDLLIDILSPQREGKKPLNRYRKATKSILDKNKNKK